MESKRFTPLPNMAVIFLFGLTSMLGFCQATAEGVEGHGGESGLETYIVFVSKPEGTITAQSQDLDSYYQSFLPDSITNSKSQPQRMVHTYRDVASGFAVKLTAEEAKTMVEKEGVLSARSQKILPLHTTHSPEFLGLQQNSGLRSHLNYGKGVIIGVLDTGITPGHPSFNDEGMPPPPAKWKGKCEFPGTQCNRKLIGARNFLNDEETSKGSLPYDQEGHGTHTASTAAGTFVKDANVYGNANGTAVGMAPLAHLAMYRVCGHLGCPESDILAAMDAAAEDGVDVLSLSLGGGSVSFPEDSIAVGAFGAIQKGIFVSCSAGNAGPLYGSLSNEAPWILTVGASTIDRSIRTKVLLGNGRSFLGQSVFQPEISVPVVPHLIDAHRNNSRRSGFCGRGSLNGLNVKGKIVLCEVGGGVARIAKGREVKNAGGSGMILMNNELGAYTTLADVHVLPASHVSYADGINIQSYINSTSSPMATIGFQGTVIGLINAPSVTSFSSRGPSLASPGILKPDIIGPGLSIIAAWPVSVENKTDTKATFNVISGTSMSCPHLSGIAALLKSFHPDWSPAAIKSAMMTTAYSVNRGGYSILDERRLPADILATGAGHIDPTKAINPGLVYDISPEDYIPYLCGLGYTDRDISYIVQRKIKCSDESSIPQAQLNYPSFSIVFSNRTLWSQKYTRTVTNVGPAYSNYTAVVTPPAGVSISVHPRRISFTGVNQKATYSVIFSWIGGNTSGRKFSQGNLIWASDNHTVKSPILILFSESW